MSSALNGGGLPPDAGPDDSLAYIQLATVGSLCGLAVLVFLLRIPLRLFVLKSVGSDDYLMAVSVLMGIGTLVCFVGETNAGMGRHSYYLLPENQATIAHWQFYHSIIVMLGISFVKLSVGAVLLRFVSTKGYKRVIWGMIIFLTLFTIACAGTLIFSCVPPSASWDFSKRPTAKCFSLDTFTGIGLFNSAVNAFTDLAFVALPVPIILKLQVNMRTKISLILILGLGVFACVASLVKISYQVNVLKEHDGTRYNLFNVWNAIELYVGIVAACLPTLRPLVKHVLDTTRSWSAWSRPSGNARSGYGNVSGAAGSRQRASVLRQSRASKGFRRQEDDDSEELTNFSAPVHKSVEDDKDLETRVRIQAFSRPGHGSDDNLDGTYPQGGIMKTTDFSVH